MTRVSEAGVEAASSATADRLLSVAAYLFRVNGYAATTTRQLAQELNLQKGSLYHHIATKEDLLYRICTDAAHRLLTSVTQALAEAPEDQRLQALMRAHLRAALEDRDMHAVTLIENRGLTEARRAEVVRRREAYMDMLVDVIRNEQKAGRIRKDMSPKMLALALLDTLNWVIFWYQPDGMLGPEEVADSLSEIYLNGAAERARPPRRTATKLAVGSAKSSGRRSSASRGGTSAA